MTADALQMLPNAETLLYPLVSSYNKSAASNQLLQISSLIKQTKHRGWHGHTASGSAAEKMPWCCAQGSPPQAKIHKVRAHEPKSHMFAAVMTEPNDEGSMLTCLRAATFYHDTSSLAQYPAVLRHP